MTFKFSRRAGIALMACTALTLSGEWSDLRAQEQYPSRQITLLVPYPAGGFVDIAARYLADGLREQLQQPVVILNRPGANGKVALGELVRSAPDGYTLLVNNDGGIGIPPAADLKFPHTPEKDFVPIAQFADAKYLLTIRGDLPIKTTGELVEYARANPGKLTFGSPGLATSPHMAMEMLMRETKTEMVHAPYPGAAPAMTDLLKGVIDILVNSVPGTLSQIDSKSIKVLSVIDKNRIKLAPNVPTIEEAGIKQISIGGWVGLFGPAGLPKPVVEKLNAAIEAAMKNPDLAKKMSAVGADATFKGIKEFPGFYRSEVEKWRRFSDETGIKVGK